MIIIKIDKDGTEHNFGGGHKSPYDVIPKGYKFNGLFYEKTGSKSLYIVELEAREKEKEGEKVIKTYTVYMTHKMRSVQTVEAGSIEEAKAIAYAQTFEDCALWEEDDTDYYKVEESK